MDHADLGSKCLDQFRCSFSALLVVFSCRLGSLEVFLKLSVNIAVKVKECKRFIYPCIVRLACTDAQNVFILMQIVILRCQLFCLTRTALNFQFCDSNSS